MSLLTAKCPECNSTIEVDNSKSAAICSVCREPFVVKEAIDNLTQKDQKGHTIVKFGNYEWIVLKEYSNGYSFIVSKDAICRKQFNTKYKSVMWKDSTLRGWLNNDFLIDSFTKEERSKIGIGTVPPDEVNSYLKELANWTRDRVFLLSIKEARALFPDDEHRKCRINGFSCFWWLRTPVKYSDFAAYVDYDGSINTDGFFVAGKTGCVRPAMIVKGI